MEVEDLADSTVDILLVEDNNFDAELMLRALSDHRLRAGVHRVKDGEEALDYLFRRGAYRDRAQRADPRVILLDLKLPKVDGTEVLSSIRANPSTRCLPVVVITSSREHRDVTNCYRLGANSFVTKPLDFAEFQEAMAQLGLYWMFVNVPPVRETG
jgi:two-component system response regulator